jgi:hypothetical protein
MEGNMPSKKIILLSILFITLVGGCATTKVALPPGTLNAAEVTALFAGKTVESRLDKSGRISKTYYTPSGETRQLQKGQLRNGTWRVQKNGRICLQFEGDKEKCRAIIQEGPVYRKYIIKRDGNHLPIITYLSFRSGDQVGR